MANSNKTIEPVKGTLNANTTKRVITEVSIIDKKSGGAVFPTRISNDVSGETISWSKVPISLSLAIESEVKTSTIVVARIVIKEITVYQRNMRFGLYQFLMSRFIFGTAFALLEKVSFSY